MKLFHCLCFLLFFKLGFAQGFGYTTTYRYDTIYHPFYRGEQLIEIVQLDNMKTNFRFVQTIGFPQVSKNLPMYIVRNQNGTIVRTYNVYQRTFQKSDFLSPERAKKKEIPHHREKPNWSYYTQEPYNGYDMLYPFFVPDKNSNSIYEYKVGLLDTNLNVVFDPVYTLIDFYDSIFMTLKGSDYEIFDYQMRRINTGNCEQISFLDYQNNLLLVKQNGKLGIINYMGQILLPLEYDYISSASYFGSNYFSIKQDEKFGVVDTKFTRLIKPFSSTARFKEVDGFFLNHNYSDKWEVLRADGSMVFFSEKQVFSIINPQRYVVGDWQARYLVDEKSKMLTDKKYFYLWPIGQNTLLGAYDAKIIDEAQLLKPTKWVILDENGVPKNNEIYKHIELIDSSFFKCYTQDGKLTVVNANGIEILSGKMTNVFKVSKNWYCIFINDEDGKQSYQFIDLENPHRKSLKYDAYQGMSDGMAIVKRKDKWTVIDASFAEKIPLIADQISLFKHGNSILKKGNKWIVFNKKGELLLDAEFDDVQLLEDGSCVLNQENKYGYLSAQGILKIPLIYSQLFAIRNKDNYVLVAKKDEHFGVLTTENTEISPFIYDKFAEISVHASIDQKRVDGYYAFMTIEYRHQYEYYYLNFDPQKNQLKTVENSSLGFEVCECGDLKSPGKKRYGVKNWNGILVVPCIYSYIGDFKHNTFLVSTEQGRGLVDTTGRVVLPAAYKYVYDLGSDQALIQVGRHYGPWGLYEYSGRQIADTIYGGFERPIFGLIPFYANFNFRLDKQAGFVHDEKRVGFMNFNGEIVIPAIYERYTIPDQNKTEIALVLNNEWVKVNTKGEFIEGSKDLLNPKSEGKPPVKKSKRRFRRK